MVEDAKIRASKLKFPIAYIYCDHSESNTLTASSILASFVKQLLLYLDILPWPALVQEKLEYNLRHSRKCLLPHELISILFDLLSVFDKVVFFVDGLDECDSKERDELLYSLDRLQHNQDLKVFVASREEMDVSQYLPNRLHISVSKENIAADICLYVEKAVANNIVNKGLTSTSSVIQDIKSSLIQGSQGM